MSQASGAPPRGDIFDATPIERVAINMFYGWGYNFYRMENQLRADDLMVRHQAAATLSRARMAIGAAEATFRRDRLPEPTREQPTHDPQALRDVRRLEALGARITALAGLVRALPVPENDRITQRHRREANTLERLLLADARLMGNAEQLRLDAQGKDGDAILASEGEMLGRIDFVEKTLRERADILKVT